MRSTRRISSTPTSAIPRYYKECKSLFPCGSPFEIDQGLGGHALGQLSPRPGQLLKEAGYDGTPIVLMQPTDIAGHTNLAPVAKSLLEKAGFKVDLQPMDWQTLVARRTKKDPLDAGRLERLLHLMGLGRHARSGRTGFLNASCDKATFGWPCDAELEKLRDAVRQGDRSGQAEGHRREP